MTDQSCTHRSQARQSKRYLKSYKYKHKLRRESRKPHSQAQPSCDSPQMVLVMMFLLVQQLATSLAFCPARCHCNDLELWANCTQVPSISIVPMTLNPLLKRLVLNQLPISELSNSLSIYRQLEYLNLNSNQLARIRYQNFNFKPAPHVISLAHQEGMGSHANSQVATTNEHNEQQAKHIRHSLERSQLLDTQDDEIRHHLRELHLADNKLEHLGEFVVSHSTSGFFDGIPSSDEPLDTEDPSDQHPQRIRHLRSQELEKLAPFLTLNKLEVLNLSMNKLTRIHQHAFLGLLRLERLDLSRNQLDHIDRHAFVGLLALKQLDLSFNRLAHHQHQLAHLQQIICRGPLLMLEELNLNDNAPTSQQQLPMADQHYQLRLVPGPHLVLPNQLAICAPKLRRLNLRALRLKYIQVNAFDNLNHLDALDLSGNLLEQVPLDSLLYATNSNLSLSLRELDLSRTRLEFVASNTFRPLRHLERLVLSDMPQLISFDLASLVTHEQVLVESQQKMMQHLNLNLKELVASNNKRLQSFHSSLMPRGRIRFEQLRLLDIAGASELRELQLDRMIQLARTDAFVSLQPLQVDLSNSNNLNCSSCQMAWLVHAAKQQQQRRQQQLNAESLPIQQPQAVPSSSQLTWSPIAFGSEYANGLPAAHITHNSPVNRQSKLQLSHLESVNCAWPFSLPLLELIGLETNYAPLFHHDASACGAPDDANVTTNNQNPSRPRADEQEVAPKFTNSSPSSGNTQQMQDDAHEMTLSGAPLWLGSALLSCLLLSCLVKLAHLLVRRHRARLKFSPSYTATTSLDDSPSSSGGSSSSQVGPPGFNQRATTLVASTTRRPDGSGLISTRALADCQWPPVMQHHHHHHHQQQQQQQQLAYGANWDNFKSSVDGAGAQTSRRGGAMGHLRAKLQKFFGSGHDRDERPFDRRRRHSTRPESGGSLYLQNSSKGWAATRQPKATTTMRHFHQGGPMFHQNGADQHQRILFPDGAGDSQASNAMLEAQIKAARPFGGGPRELEELHHHYQQQRQAAELFLSAPSGRGLPTAAKSKQSNLFLRFVERLSAGPPPPAAAAASTAVLQPQRAPFEPLPASSLATNLAGAGNDRSHSSHTMALRFAAVAVPHGGFLSGPENQTDPSDIYGQFQYSTTTSPPPGQRLPFQQQQQQQQQPQPPPPPPQHRQLAAMTMRQPNGSEQQGNFGAQLQNHYAVCGNEYEAEDDPDQHRELHYANGEASQLASTSRCREVSANELGLGTFRARKWRRKSEIRVDCAATGPQLPAAKEEPARNFMQPKTRQFERRPQSPQKADDEREFQVYANEVDAP